MNDKRNNGLRVFVDTNILISAVLSETSISAKLIQYVIEEHELLAEIFEIFTVLTPADFLSSFSQGHNH